MSITHQTRQGKRKHLSLWHRTPPAIRGAIVGFSLWIVMLFCTGVIGYNSQSGYRIFVCYPLQFILFAINGMMACWQADTTVQVQRDPIKRRPLSRSSYVQHGALAGLALGVLMGITYLLVRNNFAATDLLFTAVEGTYFFDTIWLNIVVDTVAAMGLGLLGGVLFDHLWSWKGDGIPRHR